MKRKRRLSWTLKHLPVDSRWWHHHDYSGRIKPDTGARGCERKREAGRDWEKWERRRRTTAAVGAEGIRWPLGHSLLVQWDRADSQVSRSHTCVSEIYCWVGGLMTPSWCLTVNLMGMEDCILFWVWTTSKTKRTRERRRRGEYCWVRIL